MLVGLTATPRGEIDRNTYKLFDLKIGMPTDQYEFRQAVDDKWLNDFQALSVPLKFARDGIRYNELSDNDKYIIELAGYKKDTLRSNYEELPRFARGT